MKNKINILIIASIIALLALSGIQAYLINNTYTLKKDAFIDEAKHAVEDINDIDALDSLYGLWAEDFLNHLADYKTKRITRSEAIHRFTKSADSINKQYNKIYEAEVEALNLKYDVQYKNQINAIVILDEFGSDTLFPYNATKSIVLFGSKYTSDKDHITNKTRWFTEHQFLEEVDGQFQSNSFDLEVKTNHFILLKGWKKVLFSRLASLFLGSIFVFLFVIGLLYYSIKNLINQKRVAEVKTDFINNITHELKTPLATLGIATKSLKKDEIRESPIAFDNTLNIVDRQNSRLQKLIDQVMTNSLSSKEIVLSKEQIVDNNYFGNLVQDFELSNQYRGITIKNEVIAQEVLLRIDHFHFTTALLNILDNAVKYGDDEIEITLKTAIKNNYYLISISDNGIGISLKEQQYILDKFYRVSAGDVHDVKGLGLGLYYTNQIINAHKGTIDIESELGKGSTFTIKIPIK